MVLLLEEYLTYNMFTIKRKNKRKKVINYFLVHLLVQCQKLFETRVNMGAGINDLREDFQRQVYEILDSIFDYR